MNQQLWNQVLAYHLDAPFSEYGFSLRLAHENYWTQEFTQLAIVEYKKFMYLAATSDAMVSPSGIVDIVWHQHLIFTQSYETFCTILGKRIQHVPSTHDKKDFQKFRQAKERTAQLYEASFGVQPASIWVYDSMYDSLNLVKSRVRIEWFVSGGILAMVGLLAPFYWLLLPLYARWDHPLFLYALLMITILIFAALEIINRVSLGRMMKAFTPDSFINHLQPMELVYLKTGKLEEVINGTLNEMLEKGLIDVSNDQRIHAGVNKTSRTGPAEAQVLAALDDTGPTFYPIIAARLTKKPVFTNILTSMQAFTKYFCKSREFVQIFYINFLVLALLIVCAATRIVTGIAREKPVFQIIVVTICLIVAAAYFLRRLAQQPGRYALPHLYKNHILPLRKEAGDGQWTYFLTGAAALGSFFTAINRQAPAAGDSGGGSDAFSSCGSSCSSCGGCGGD